MKPHVQDNYDSGLLEKNMRTIVGTEWMFVLTMASCFFAYGLSMAQPSTSTSGSNSFLISNPTLARDEEAVSTPTTNTTNQLSLPIAAASPATSDLPLPTPSIIPQNPSPTPIPSVTSYTNSKSALLGSSTDSNSLPTNAAPALGTNSTFFVQDLEKKGNSVPASTKALMDAGTKVKSGVVAMGAPRLTIDDCVKTALQKNPSILTAIDTIRQQSGNFITVRSAIIPQFGVTNAAYAWIDPQLNNKGNLPANQVPLNQTWGLQLGGSQLLYNGGTAEANIKAAKFSEQIAYYNLRVTIDSIIAQIIAAFYQVVLNRALVVANQQSVELLASQVEDQKSRFDAGTVPRFNVLQAEVQLANAQPGLITARNNLRISLFQLVQLIGMNYPNLNAVEVPFEVVGELVYQPRKINTDESIHTALQRSPTLKSQRQNILMMAENITAALGGYLPTMTATGGYQYLSFDGSYSNGSTVYSHNLNNFVSGWFFGVQGNWAIFDGLATYGNVKQAKANLMIAKTAYDNSVRQVILSVQQAISNMQQAKETVDSQKANVLQAAEALRLAQERLNAGAGVQLDVLNAQVQLLQAQTTVLQSEYNYIAYTAQYDQALSLNTQYEELFDDPMNHREKGRYKMLNSSKNPQPLLPKSLRGTDPLPVEFTKAKPIVKKISKKKNKE
ncbi:MAG: TolC family protein [Chthoniobacterales bacterium]